jgi:hypothetical protein
MTYLTFYQFYSDGYLELEFSNGQSKLIQLTKNSGRLVTRKKVDTLLDINHPGIYIGIDHYTNEVYVLHNHYKIFGTAGISSFKEYAAGETVYWDNRPCENDQLTVLNIGLNHAYNKEPYHWLNNNCQVTVNDACNNVRSSEDVSKWIGRIALSALAFFVVPKVIAAFKS